MPTGGSTFLRIWAVTMVLTVILMGSLALFTFGAVCFSGLFFLWLKEKWGNQPTGLDRVNGVMLFLCVNWFVLNIGVEISGSREWEFCLLPLALLFPPLLYTVYYFEGREQLRRIGIWKLILAVLYVGGFGLSIFGLMVFLFARETVDFSLARFLILGMSGLFLLAGVASGLIVLRMPTRRSGSTRTVRRMNILLLVVMVVMFAVAISSYLVQIGAGGSELFEWISLLSRGLPLGFLFVNSYYESSFAFFDVFVKRATLFFLILIGLVGFFVLVPRWMAGAVDEAWLRPWVLALILAPAVTGIPTLYRLLESWFDRHWLGRTLSSVDAVQAFFEAVGRATGEADLIREAEQSLCQIFQTESQIAIGTDPEPAFEVCQRIPIRLDGEPSAEIRLGPRPNRTPYFAQDLTLVKALSDMLAYLWQILQLQRKRREQEVREQELTLEASRSQLKALRAQINPHFLFNALNVIASLVHRDPDRAEATVEQLAEVFRYTLTRSEQEWVRIEDEMEFIHAYLEVAKARFGDRLQVTTEVDPELMEWAIPSMMVQTLVENAFKHGLALVRGIGVVEIQVARSKTGIEIRVSDNGPGSKPEASGGKSKGYGLKNISSRLAGYYKDKASMTLERDEVRGRTVAILRLPGGQASRTGQRRGA